MKKNRLLAFALSLVLVFVSVGLVACQSQQSTEDMIRQHLDKELASVTTKEAKENFVEGFMSGAQLTEDSDIDPLPLAEAFLDSYDYKIGEISVDEKAGTATAEVEITIKDLYNTLLDLAANPTSDELATLSSANSADETEATQVLLDLMVKRLDASEPITRTAELNFTRNDETKKWEIDEDSLMKAFFGTTL